MPRASFSANKSKRRRGSGPALSRQPRPIAVDFGTSALKVVQVTGADSPTLVAAACLDTPPELFDDPAARIAFQTQQLPSLVRSAGFKGKRAACLLPSSMTFCKHLQVAKGDPTTVEAATKIAMATQLSCDPNALVLRHTVVGPVGQDQHKLEVIGLAAARSTVECLMRALHTAKLEPVGMHPESVALLAAFNAVGAAENDTTTLYLDLGFGTTKAFIARGPKLLFARTFEFGGRALDQSLASRWKVSISRAHEARRTCSDFTGVERAPVASLGTLNGSSGSLLNETRKMPNVMPDLDEAFEILGDEVAMCIRYHRSMFPSHPVERAVFTGGESVNLGLCRKLAGTVRVAVQTGDPMGTIHRTGKEPARGVDTQGPMPGWAAAFGVAMSPTDL